MIEASTTCPGCGHEMRLCVCDEQTGPLVVEIRRAIASAVVRAGAAGLALVATAVLVRCQVGG